MTFKIVMHHNQRQDGQYLLYLRITHNSSHYVNTKVHADPKYFNKKKGEFHKSYPNHILMNIYLRKIKYSAELECYKQKYYEKPVTSKQIAKHVRESLSSLIQ